MSLFDDARTMTLLVNIFKEVDEDRNGVIDFEEFSLLMTRNLGITLSVDELAALFERFDEDKNGTIEFSEFIVLIENAGIDEYLQRAAAGIDLAAYGLRPDMSADIVRTCVYFRLADLNDDGVLSPLEIRTALFNLCGSAAPTLEQVEAAVARLDRDGDGQLDVEEFHQLLRGFYAD
eukprot:gnl/Chilomastix_cuspidata/5001.p1 GENE.gnl/Chilomastix_cuspidata/5001~~gnl/Chilomastix_cuspidata/5001.p1  ORF type:complete len:177 (-),score=97.46 gnl/Chilomastix_cuspidata/5001:8-538(-)